MERARALLTRNADMHFRRWRQLERSVAMCDAAARLRSTHFASCSANDDNDIGGVMTLIRHDLADADSMRTTTILLGRILITSVQTHDGSPAHFANVHNYDVPDAAARLLGDHMRSATPPEYIFIAGGWNFPSDAGGTKTTTMGRGDTTTGRARKLRTAWRSALRHTTELGHEFPTRAAEISTGDTKAITMSSIDRAYTTVPPPSRATIAPRPPTTCMSSRGCDSDHRCRRMYIRYPHGSLATRCSRRRHDAAWMDYTSKSSAPATLSDVPNRSYKPRPPRRETSACTDDRRRPQSTHNLASKWRAPSPAATKRRCARLPALGRQCARHCRRRTAPKLYATSRRRPDSSGRPSPARTTLRRPRGNNGPQDDEPTLATHNDVG